MSAQATIVSRRLQEIAAKIDDLIEEAAGERIPFSLFVWTEERFNYVSSSSDREGIAKALESAIRGWRQGMPDIPAHKING